MNEQVAVIVQARMGSTRLPGKVLADLAGAPMLVRILERLKRCEHVDHWVVATTTLPADDPIVELAHDVPSVCVTRGSETDVLRRYHEANAAIGADIVVRITADCPLVEPPVVDRSIDMLRKDSAVDYVSNCMRRTFPRGLDVEVIRATALSTAHREATRADDREHVTPFIWRQPHRFRLVDLVDTSDNSDLRWTVDTPADLAVIRRIYDALYPTNPHFNYAEALAYVRSHPHIMDMNRHVSQKHIQQ